MDLYPLLIAISEVTDLVSPLLVDHHKKVSYIAANIGEVLGLDAESKRQLAMAGIVHDVGGLSLRSRLASFEFEVTEPERHCLPGYVLLAGFEPFAQIARLVRFHHVYWRDGSGREIGTEEVPLLSHIIHLADRVAVQIDAAEEILSQKRAIVEQIKQRSGDMFVPEQVDAFREVAAKEVFWLDLTSPLLGTILRERFPHGDMALQGGDLLDLAELFRKMIDFRSRFTATHSSGVAAVAAAVGKKAGFSGKECGQVHMAGLLHDIGKLVVPDVILEKQTPLTIEDFAVIRKHPYFSERILRSIAGFSEVSQWAALHHERLDGTGYPYRCMAAKLPPGARVLAVADTFTALTEDRPYRCGIGGIGTGRIMEDMAAADKLDGDVVALIQQNIEEMDQLRQEAQLEAEETHRRFLTDCRMLGADLEERRCPDRSNSVASLEIL